MNDQNPYEAPLIVAELADDENERAERSKRPPGVAILAVLHLLLGLLLVLVFGLLVYASAQFGTPQSRYTELAIALVIVGLSTIVFVGSAVGLWLGTPWGWWLASFTHAWSIVASISTVILAILQVEPGDFGLPTMLMHAFYAVLSGLAINYLFRPNVRRYCASDSRSAAWSMATLFGIAIILVAAATFGAKLAA